MFSFCFFWGSRGLNCNRIYGKHILNVTSNWYTYNPAGFLHVHKYNTNGNDYKGKGGLTNDWKTELNYLDRSVTYFSFKH